MDVQVFELKTGSISQLLHNLGDVAPVLDILYFAIGQYC